MLINNAMNQRQNTFNLFNRHGLFLTLILLITISGCTPSHVLHFKEDVSRDYTYIDFVRNPDPFVVRTSVGGEHIKTIKILSFEGDKFILEFTNHQGEVMFNISDGDAEYKRMNEFSGTIIIRNLDSLVSIETSAHPYAEYTLTITPLNAKKQKSFNLFF